MIAAPPLWMYLTGFLLLLGPLVTVHELGHYLVGRWFGVKADKFSVGFGKELAGFTDSRGTRWRLSALPLGGYVQFAGDINPAGQSSPEWLALPAAERALTFQAKPLWQRALIVAAGPVTNLLLAVAILAAFNLAYGRPVLPPRIGEIQAGSSADLAGLRKGDLIVALDGEPVTDFLTLRQEIMTSPGVRFTMTVEREGERRTVGLIAQAATISDEFGNKGKVGRLGIAPAGKVEIVRLGPVTAVTQAVRDTGGILVIMVRGIRQIVTGVQPLSELGGPIKIAKVSGERLTLGWIQFAELAAMVSINLAFINALPIPGLDGGHLAFYAAEAIRRKPLGKRSQEWAFRTGLAFVLALMLFVTINDIVSLPALGG
ncbi:MAG: RIP metalloprotease RseP [Croceibacterium sp.]